MKCLSNVQIIFDSDLVIVDSIGELEEEGFDLKTFKRELSSYKGNKIS